ncbi:hypothetical protein BJV82DRAFT_661920 [Fennellomyces sp. T-0311]|nr:hypothetical protein BJV82DRAFT_661920 [Fennellomyces sp. T-0311]
MYAPSPPSSSQPSPSAIPPRPAEQIPSDIADTYKRQKDGQLLWFAAPPTHLLSDMLSRSVISRIAVRPIVLRRPYHATPSVPQPGEKASKELPDNDIHALYNKDNVSMLEVDHHDTTYRSLSDGSNAEAGDSFSPTFNTVFDE